MDRLRQFEVLLAIGTHGGFSAAARALRISPAAVSGAVAELEHWSGARLFERTTRRVSLTEEGEALSVRVRHIIDGVEDARSRSRSSAQALAGRLRVSAPLGYGITRLGAVSAAFLAEHPGMRLEVDFSDRHVDLIAEQFDVAIRLGELRDRALAAQLVDEHRLVLCGAPAYLAKAGPLRHPRDLRLHRCLVSTRRAPVGRLTFRRGHETVAVDVPAVLSANNGLALVEAAVSGAGLTLAPDFLVGHALAAGELEQVCWGWAGARLPLHIVTAPGPRTPRRVQAFVARLMDQLPRGQA